MNIILGKKEYELKGVTINQYLEVQKLNKNKQSISNAEYIELLTGIDKKLIRDATVQQIGFVAKALNSYYNNSTTNSPVRPLINYKNKMYGLSRPSTMTWGQWSDLEVLTSQKELDLKHIASVLYLPCEKFNVETNEYTTITYDHTESLGRSVDFGDFLVKDIISSLLFFLKYGRLLIDKQKEYSETKKKTMEESLHQMIELTKKNSKD